MLKFKLNTNQQTFNKRFTTSEKSPIFQSHKSYKIPLQLTADFRSQIHSLNFRV
jgi:hypothetical protein